MNRGAGTYNQSTNCEFGMLAQISVMMVMICNDGLPRVFATIETGQHNAA